LIQGCVDLAHRCIIAPLIAEPNHYQEKADER